MDFFRSLFLRRKRSENQVPGYDQPFAMPRTRRIIIPPKPGSMKGRSIAPRTSPMTEANSILSGDQTSILLFGSPLESVKTADTVGNIRYPTTALFAQNNKISKN